MKFKKYIIEQKIREKKKKAGIIPYYIGDNGITEILLMKPSNPNYGGDYYQIAKGEIDKDEDIKNTALREGKEELGLKSSNISNSVFMGFNDIKDYELYIYLVEVKNKQDFNTPHYETGSTKWFKSYEIDDIRKEHISIVKECFDKISSRSKLNEWKVHKSYSGRELIKPNETILWQYIPNKGLLHTYSDGSTYLDDKKIGFMTRSDDYSSTHKKQLASFYKELGFEEPNMRQWIENNYESFVRGRIVGNDLYVYSIDYVGIESKKYNKMVDRAIDAIYNFVK